MTRPSSHRPRAGLTAMAALLLALPLTACLEADETLVLDADLAGEIRQVWTQDLGRTEDALQALARLHGRDDPLDPRPFARPFHPGWIEALAAAAPGVSVEVTDHQEGDGLEVVAVRTRFRRLADAARAGAFFDTGLDLVQRADGAWRLRLRPVWADAVLEPEGEVGGRPRPELLDALSPALAPWSRRRTVVLPTPVLSTTGTVRPDGRTVDWHYGWEDLREGRDPTLEVVFGCPENLSAPDQRHRPDVDELLRRGLEPPPGVRGW